MLRRILFALLGLMVLAIIGLAFTIQYTGDCPAPSHAAAGDETMQAVRRPCYGSPDVLQYTTLKIPDPGPGQILVKVEAAAVNPLDSHFMRGSPYILRLMLGIGTPDDPRIGRDFAGTVVDRGAGVTEFEPGDRVFGGVNGAFAQYDVRGASGSVARIPEGVSFDEAAAVPIAGVTALQALRDHGKLEAGQRVLINGASGGVGTFAVQIAKAMGAHVSGVCSGRNVAMVQALGADQVFNYKEEDYTQSGQQFDLIVDMVGNHSPLANTGVLTPSGRLVIVGGDKGNWIAPFKGAVMASLTGLFVDQEMAAMTAEMLPEDLATVAGMIAAGQLTPEFDRRFPLSDTAEAMRYLETRRARGKIIVDPWAEESGGATDQL